MLLQSGTRCACSTRLPPTQTRIWNVSARSNTSAPLFWSMAQRSLNTYPVSSLNLLFQAASSPPVSVCLSLSLLLLSLPELIHAAFIRLFPLLSACGLGLHVSLTGCLFYASSSAPLSSMPLSMPLSFRLRSPLPLSPSLPLSASLCLCRRVPEAPMSTSAASAPLVPNALPPPPTFWSTFLVKRTLEICNTSISNVPDFKKFPT